MAAPDTAEEIEAFQKLTEAISQKPEDYTVWLQRCRFFEEHSYRQLAILDAYKAYKLTKAKASIRRRVVAQLKKATASDSNGNPVQETAEQLVKCLLAIGALNEASSFEPDCRSIFQTAISLESLKDEARGIVGGPMISRQQFPWCFERNEKDLDAVRTAFSKNKLELRESRLSGGIPGNLGVFATRTYERGDTVFTESCQTASLHEFFQEQTGTVSGPLLEDEAYSTLATEYSIPQKTLDFDRDIVAYIETMDRKPFTPNRDHWVFLVRHWRIDNNVYLNRGGRLILGKLGSFLNHSCVPNVGWVFVPDSTKPHLSTVELTPITAQGIKAGEELFVSYLGVEQLIGNVSARRKKLQKWLGLGIDCQCEKCKAEEAREASV